MKTIYRVITLPILISSLTACLDSDSSDSDGDADSYLSVIAEPANYTQEQLNTAYGKKIEADYSGSTDVASLDIASAQSFYKQAFGSEAIYSIGLGRDKIGNLLVYGNVNEQVHCDGGGSVAASGSYDATKVSTITLNYEHCNEYYEARDVKGIQTIKVNSNTQTRTEFTVYMNEIEFQNSINDTRYKATGYTYSYINNAMDDGGNFEAKFRRHLVFTSLTNQEQLAIESDFSYTYFPREERSVQGEKGIIRDSNLGEVSYEFDKINDYYNGDVEEYVLTGDTAIKLERVGYGAVKFLVDDNKDGDYELGAYVGSFDTFETLQATDINLVAIDDMTLPPVADMPRVLSYQPKTSDALEVSAGYYHDEDTPNEELNYSFRWYVNGVLVEGETSNVLPPYIAVFGDEVKVTMVVSDGRNITESYPVEIHLEDSPAEISISGAPETINAGDEVAFVAQIVDPDIRQNDSSNAVSAELVSGPQGATVDEQGRVYWQTPAEQFFPQQEFTFVFANPSNEEESLQSTLTVNSEAKLPLVRSGVEVPKSNYSMWVGDFTGDGQQEVLSTDSRNRIFLLSEEDGKYAQSWMYPFKVPTKGQIRQVVGVNTDGDSALEILVITDEGISLIEGTDKMAKVVLEDKHISFVAVADSDGDGELEIAYLLSDSDHSYSSDELKVVRLADPDEVIFSTSLSETREIAFANVDSDAALELVANSGLVYDGATWANEWFKGTKFGDSYIAVGDFDGDGVAEIAGGNGWDSLALYSATSKEQLVSMDNFNTCVIQSANIDSDIADELLIGDCQWGSISAYDYKDNKLTKLWAVDMGGHGSKSITVGDSDNDGKLEVHWGTGQSYSGEDVFVVADVEDQSAVVKEGSKSIQLQGYSSAGWTNDSAVFFIPKTNSGYDGSRVIIMDENGKTTLSEEISSNWDNSQFATVTDFNNDGLDDIFMPSTSTYDGSFAAKQLNDLSTHWELAGDYDDDIGVIRAYDLNSDGFDDAVYVNSNKINAIDIQNQLILASYKFDAYIWDFALTQVNGEHLMAVSQNYKLMLLKKGTSAFSDLDVTDKNCSRLEFANVDSDEQMELVCLIAQDHWSIAGTELVIFDIVENKLVELNKATLSFKALDFAVDTSTEMNQKLFMTSQEGDSSSYYDDENNYRITRVDAEGNLIWSSPALVGQPSRQGLKYKFRDDSHNLILSTNSSMYMIEKDI